MIRELQVCVGRDNAKATLWMENVCSILEGLDEGIFSQCLCKRGCTIGPEIITPETASTCTQDSSYKAQ